jgi:8-oxo-dGTP diphosphatase
MQTMGPYAAASGVRIRPKGGLTEATYRRSPGKARRHTQRLLESAHGGALCTHRPVLEGVMEVVREWSTPEVAQEVPDANPYLHPGDVLVAHTAHRHGVKPRVVAVERHGTR